MNIYLQAVSLIIQCMPITVRPNESPQVRGKKTWDYKAKYVCDE